MTFKTDLPIQRVLPALKDALHRHGRVVLTAPPGAGKSTVIPPALLDAGFLNDGRLIMLEPRRIAARMCAMRMAAMLGESVGQRIGYQIRFDRKTSSDTRIIVVTEGILTRRLTADPLLEGVSTVVIDEFHERSVHVDLALAFLRDLSSVRDDLKIVVMSATLDAERLQKFLSPCDIVTCHHAPFSVDIRYIDRPDTDLSASTIKGIRTLLATMPDNGDVLVFLPGAPEIERVRKKLIKNTAFEPFEIIPLYGALPHAAQDRALIPGSKRRIVLATNIAETSLTIPRVTGVVDTGLKKEIRFDAKLGLDRLETVPISNDNADQRAGRAGRLAPGSVLRLWTRYEQQSRPQRDIPEVSRVDTCPILMQLLAFGETTPANYPLLDPMDPTRAQNGMALLKRLGALTTHGLSPSGKTLASLPLHPRLGAILVHAESLHVPQLGATVAALASEPDIAKKETLSGESISDFDFRVSLFEAFEQKGGTADAARQLGIHFPNASLVQKVKRQLLKIIGEDQCAPPRIPDIGTLLLAGFPDRVCKMSANTAGIGTMVGGQGIRVNHDNTKNGLFIAVSIQAGKRGSFARSVVTLKSSLSVNVLKENQPDLFSIQVRPKVDTKSGVVTVYEANCFIDLCIEEKKVPSPDPLMIQAALVEAAAMRFDTYFKPDKSAEHLIARLRYANRIRPDLSLPDLSTEGLKAFLPMMCEGKRTLTEVAQGDWTKLILSGLPYDTRQKLDALFPESYTLPSKRVVAIDYTHAGSDEEAPVLAWRLQEFFGLSRTPTIANGKIPLTLHLLAPNGRPCQITKDIESFWTNTYPQVRKDLRGRYPKHHWPEDPFSATASTKIRPSPSQ